VLGVTMGPPAMIGRLNIEGVLVYSAPADGPAGQVCKLLQLLCLLQPAVPLCVSCQQCWARARSCGNRCQPLGCLAFASLVTQGSRVQAGIQGCTRTQYGDLVVGDIIVGLNGKPVKNYADLFDILDECKPGDRIKVDIYRTMNRTRKTVDVTLGQRTLDNQDG
jgi:S1-C subfamily serine protease